MQVIVVTGGTRGIGLGIADALLARGQRVVVCGRAATDVDRVVAELGAAHYSERVAGFPCDVTDVAAVQALWNGAVERFGRVDIWINNAGLGSGSTPLWEQEAARLAAVVDTNITASMYGCAIAMRGMLAQGGGHIYNMEGLGSDDRMIPGTTAYGTTKRAIRYLTRALAREAAESPVKVSAISPGMVVTDLLLAGLDGKPEQMAKSRKSSK